MSYEVMSCGSMRGEISDVTKNRNFVIEILKLKNS